MKLKIEGKTYEKLRFKGRVTRNLLEIQGILSDKESRGEFTTEDLDMMCEFLVNVFENEFTTDDLLDGLEFHEIIAYFRQVAQEIMKKTNDKMEALAKK